VATSVYVKIILRFFFKLLYHQFAFAYDLVAATVSLGRWKDWVMSILPFVEGSRVLEIGFGPGHLQRSLLQRGLVAVGIDESAQMARVAKYNLRHGAQTLTGKHSCTETEDTTSQQHQLAYAQTNLTRGLAQYLPFRDHSVDTLVATFPAEYIFDLTTLTEARRVLTENGRFVIMPGAMIIGRGIWDRFMAWLFKVTRETPPNLSEILREKSKDSFAKAGFQVQVLELDVESSIVFIMIATKTLALSGMTSDSEE
jgi:ubiquinone/menaquinone biosynthesis C-methylase UbiE